MTERELTPEEVTANIAKAEAEARKADAEAEAALLTARANAAKAEAEARYQDILIAMSEIGIEADKARLVQTKHDADRAQEKRDEELAADKYHHVYRFSGAVDNSSAEKCLDQLNRWRRTEEPGEVEIVFYSPGGSVLAGMALFDFITEMRQEGWHFTTICRGYAASMAGILLQAGDVRVCGPESYILIHEISSGAVGKVGELEDEVEFVKLIQQRVNDIFVERSAGKVTGAKLRAMYRRKDFWLDSAKALKLGIVDEVR